MATKKTRSETFKATYRTYLGTLDKSVVLMDRVVDSAEICRLRLMRALDGKSTEDVKMACDAILGLQRLHTISSNLLHRSASSDLYFTGE